MVSTRRLGIKVDARIEGRNGLAWASGSWGLGDMTEELLDNATSTTTNTALNTTFPTVSGQWMHKSNVCQRLTHAQLPQKFEQRVNW